MRHASGDRRPLYRARRLGRPEYTGTHLLQGMKESAPRAATSRTRLSRKLSITKEAGIKKIATETGAGQWGSALAFAGSLFGIEISGVHGASFVQPEALPPRLHGNVRRTLRAPSPSPETNFGRQVLATSPDSNGSLGIAISEAVEVAATRRYERTRSARVLNHVLLHQTVIGREALSRCSSPTNYPDIVVGCTGGGSNFCGYRVPVHWRAAPRRQNGARDRGGAGRLPQPDARTLVHAFR